MIQRLLLIVGLVMSLLTGVNADELGLTAQEVYEMKQKGETEFLFVDVRDPVEIMFVGNTDLVDLNIPFLLVDRHDWNEEKGVFKLNLNPNFAEEIKSALAERSLSDDTIIVTMCRSGSERGKPSAEFLKKAGFKNAYYVINGFQGDAIKEGESKGFRRLNGWQNSDLPWSNQLNADKIYRD